MDKKKEMSPIKNVKSNDKMNNINNKIKAVKSKDKIERLKPKKIAKVE